MQGCRTHTDALRSAVLQLNGFASPARQVRRTDSNLVSFGGSSDFLMAVAVRTDLGMVRAAAWS